MIDLKILNKAETETEAAYKNRIFTKKDSYNLTWQDVADLLNDNLSRNDTANKYKKEYYRSLEKPDIRPVVEDSSTFSDYTRIRDERNYVKSLYRRMSRENTLKDIAKEVAEDFSVKLPLINSCQSNTSTENSVVGTLLLSDWHYGLEIVNPFNTYNPEVFHQRISTILSKTIEEIDFFNIKELNVLNLGDLISGRIHNTIRINNRIDVITQIIQVSEYVAEILNILSSKCVVHYFDCYDNHSRIEPNLSDSLSLENLTRITHWFLQERVKDNSNIIIHENEFGPDIITFTLYNKYKIAAVHGNNDKQDKTIDNISMMTRQSYDLICSAHFHHFSLDEKNMCLLVSNPSLMGTDEFSEKLRLTSKPAQTLIISTPEEVSKYIIRLTAQ